MKYNLENIFEEVEFRIDDPWIDWKNPNHIQILSEVLTELGWGNVKHQLIQNLTEDEDDDYEYIGYGYYVRKGQKGKEDAQKFTKDDAGKYSPVSKAQYDKDKEKQGADGEKAASKTSQNQQGGEEQKEEPQTGTAFKGKGGDDYRNSLPDNDPASTASDDDGEIPQKKPVEKVSDIRDTEVSASINDFVQFLSDEQKEARELSTKMRTKRLQALDELKESFDKLPPDVKNTAAVAFARGLTFEGRENSGIGKNRLGYLDVKGLTDGRERLLQAYGDGSAETVKKFVRDSRSIKVSEDYVQKSFDLLPKSLQSSLQGKGKVGDAGKNKHFLGYIKEDGTITSDRNDPNIKKDESGNLMVKRGNPGNKDRGRFVWRCILEQGCQDPYTGLPLDLSSIDLEHTVAFDNKDNGNPSEQDYLNREHDDNIIICATNVNQKKSNLSMRDFLEKHVDTQKDKSEEEFKKIGQAYEEINKISSQSEQTAALMLEEGKLKKGYDFDTLKSTFELDDEKYKSAKEEFKKVAESKKDQQKISALKSELGKDTIMAMGLSRGLTDKSGRRTIKLSSDNLYRGFVLSMADNPDRQEEYKREWENAREVGNSDEYRLIGKGQRGMIKYLVDKGLISQKVLDDKKLGKVFRNALAE